MDPQPIEDPQTLSTLSNNCLRALHEFAERQGWHIMASDVERML